MRKRVIYTAIGLLLCMTGCGILPLKPPSQTETEPSIGETEDIAEAEDTEDGDQGTTSAEALEETEQHDLNVSGVEVLSGSETKALLEKEYGVDPETIYNEESSSADSVQSSLFDLLDPYRKIDYVPPTGGTWPQDVKVTVTAPDMEKILREIDFSSITGEKELIALLEERIAADDCPQRDRTLMVKFPSKDYDLIQTRDFELLDALYGGALSFYREELEKEYLHLYEKAKEAEKE